jgi:type IV pilus assembly protein PilQ
MFATIKSRSDYARILVLLFGMGSVLFGCAQAPPKEAEPVAERPAEVQSIRVVSEPSGEKTTIEITSSRPVPYAAFKLVDPLRIVVGVTAPAAEGLTAPLVTDETCIKEIGFETPEKDPASTRVIATLSQDADYTLQDEEGIIRLAIFPKEPSEEKPAPVVAAKEEEQGAKEPRIFFLPGKSKLNQVLGVDFFMLPEGRSRITVTTSNKAEYSLSPKDSRTLLLELKEATIAPELTRHLDSSYFKGIVSKITPVHRTAKKEVDIEISLKEPAPYHVVQVEEEIRIDFNKTPIEPPAKKITEATYAKTLVTEENSPSKRRPGEATQKEVMPKNSRLRIKDAARMTLEFSNADVRNVLKLIGEVSQMNIVWGPEVKGTVSMRLKDVPWDQALEVVLETSNLGMRWDENVIWIMTREKLLQLEKEEKERQEAEEKRRKELREQEKKEKEEEKAEEPLEIEYITVNYAKVEDIRKLIEENVKGPRGAISVDEANKTIIFTDIAANITRAKELKERQDKPTKQVLIEARIVEATTSFSRDMGVGWAFSYEKGGNPWGGSGPGVITTDFATNFTVPAAAGAGVAGITFANTAGTKVLNARIALAETEGKLRTLSAPKIVTRDMVSATIKQGTTIYVPTGRDETGHLEYSEKDAALKLEVTPQITPNDMVIMKIDVSEDEPDWANEKADYVPIKTKNAQTQMMVSSGDTVIIGGIYKESKIDTEGGIPWLRKIPFIGWLFQEKNIVDSKTELLIFLTPTVLSSEKGEGLAGS